MARQKMMRARRETAAVRQCARAGCVAGVSGWGGAFGSRSLADLQPRDTQRRGGRRTSVGAQPLAGRSAAAHRRRWLAGSEALPATSAQAGKICGNGMAVLARWSLLGQFTFTFHLLDRVQDLAHADGPPSRTSCERRTHMCPRFFPFPTTYTPVALHQVRRAVFQIRRGCSTAFLLRSPYCGELIVRR